MFLKIMTGPILDPTLNRVPPEECRPYYIVSDIKSCNFETQGGLTVAVCQIREPIKTAEVPGFVENQVNINVTGPAFLMNENGKTISSFFPDADPGTGKVRVYLNDWEKVIDDSISTAKPLYDAFGLSASDLLFGVSQYGAAPLEYEGTGKVLLVNGNRFFTATRPIGVLGGNP